MTESTVAIMLSTFNGERYLGAQLDSFIAQSHTDWLLYWRDDGSSDDTRAMLEAFANGPGLRRCVEAATPGRQGATASFMTLLHRAVAGPAACFAFADQDDVWLPEKLTHGVAALSGVPEDRPALFFCARTLVDAAPRPIGLVPPPRRPLGFLAALTQNVAPGCCMMLNRAAAELVVSTPIPADTWHDWWSYLLIAAHEGAIIAGPEPDILYRQHPGNLVGEPIGPWRRGLAALRRGPRPFMTRFRRHVAVLDSVAHDLPASTRAHLTVIARGTYGGMPARIEALRQPGFVRQTWAETLVFRLWFLFG